MIQKIKESWIRLLVTLVGIVFLVILGVYFFTNLYQQHKTSPIWNLISVLGTLLSAIFAAISAIKAATGIKISNIALLDQMRPMLLFSELKSINVHTSRSKFYGVDLTFCNHGKGVCLIRKIHSENENLAAHISIPISIGSNVSTNITLFFGEKELNDIYAAYRGEDVGTYDQYKEWSIEVLEKTNEIQPYKIVKLNRSIKLVIYFWGITGDCYTNEIDLNITLTRDIHYFADVGITFEKVTEIPTLKGKILHTPEHYENFSS